MISQIKQVKAFLNLGKEKQQIGEMIENQGKIYFKYNSDFIAKGIEISPFKMKLSTELLMPKENHFDGLFGVFSDSIPDGWGKLLLDRKLLAMGYQLNQISPLDRLAHVDNIAVGAISYEPQFEKNITEDIIDLDHVSLAVNQILSGSSEDVIDYLFHLGGSSGGARPKIFVGYNPLTNEMISGMPVLPDGFEHWIIKFPSSQDFKDMAQIEYVYNQMARKAGIEVADFKLFKSQKGQSFYGCKRFDRINNEKLHLHSVCGLLQDNFRMSTLDYGHIMDCAFTLEKDFKAYEKVLRLATFNVLAHNRDDHSKNFSFLMDKNGQWKFSPAYDLTFSMSAFGHHSTTIAGEGKNPSFENLNTLAKHFGVKNFKTIFDEVQHALNDFNNIGKNAGMSKDSMLLINKYLTKE